MKLNVKLLRKIRAQILREPRQFMMSHFFATAEDGEFARDVPIKIPNCGTAACIAGWAIALSERKTPKEAQAITEGSYSEPAALALGLGPEFACGTLFDIECWPEDLLVQYKTAKTPAGRARIAAKRIDRFIAEHSK